MLQSSALLGEAGGTILTMGVRLFWNCRHKKIPCSGFIVVQAASARMPGITYYSSDEAWTNSFQQGGYCVREASYSVSPILMLLLCTRVVPVQ